LDCKLPFTTENQANGLKEGAMIYAKAGWSDFVDMVKPYFQWSCFQYKIAATA
jgi:hypothetical protein